MELLHRVPNAWTMDSLDAECLIVGATEGKLEAPRIWRHERSGALSCTYGKGRQAFTWTREDVSQMARKWRASRTKPNQRACAFLDAHKRLAALVEEAGLGPPDAVVHDMPRNELRAVWDGNDVVLVMDEICDLAGM